MLAVNNINEYTNLIFDPIAPYLKTSRVSVDHFIIENNPSFQQKEDYNPFQDYEQIQQTKIGFDSKKDTKDKKYGLLIENRLYFTSLKAIKGISEKFKRHF